MVCLSGTIYMGHVNPFDPIIPDHSRDIRIHYTFFMTTLRVIVLIHNMYNYTTTLNKWSKAGISIAVLQLRRVGCREL